MMDPRPNPTRCESPTACAPTMCTLTAETRTVDGDGTYSGGGYRAGTRLEVYDRSPFTKRTSRGERILNVAQPGVYTILPVFVLESDLAAAGCAFDRPAAQSGTGQVQAFTPQTFMPLAPFTTLAITPADRATAERVATELAERWIAERGGYVAFAYQIRDRGDGTPIDVAVEQDQTYRHALAAVRAQFERGYGWVETRGRDFLRSPAYAQALAVNAQERRLAELAPPIASETGPRARYRGYTVAHLTESDIAAQEAGFLAAAAFDEYISNIGHVPSPGTRPGTAPITTPITSAPPSRSLGLGRGLLTFAILALPAAIPLLFLRRLSPRDARPTSRSAVRRPA